MPVSITGVSLSVKQATTSDRPHAEFRLRLFLGLVIVAAALGGGWMLDRRPAALVEAGVIGLIGAAVVWSFLALTVPTRRTRRPIVEPVNDFQETRIAAIPRRRHDHEEIGVAVDALRLAVKERIEALPELGHKAGHDPLTRLADRASLYALSDWLDENDGLPQVELCLLCVELKGVEPVKARYGGEAGDHVLVKIAKRLRDVSREEDFLFRLGSDEFMLMVPSPHRWRPRAGAQHRQTRAEQRPAATALPHGLEPVHLVQHRFRDLADRRAAPRRRARRYADAALADTRVTGRGGFKQYSPTRQPTGLKRHGARGKTLNGSIMGA